MPWCMWWSEGNSSCVDPPCESRVLLVAQAGPKLVVTLLPQPLEDCDHIPDGTLSSY